MITIIEISQFMSPHLKYLHNELVNCILSASDGWVVSLHIAADLWELLDTLMPRIRAISYSVICFEFKVARGNSQQTAVSGFTVSKSFQ